MTTADVLSSPPAAARRTPVLVLGIFDVLRSDVVSWIRELALLVGPVTVGVLDDAEATARRGRPPLLGAEDRARVVGALRHVTDVAVVGAPQLDVVRTTPPPIVLWEVNGGCADDLDRRG